MATRVALVHDFLLDLRGAERVFAAICATWPEADVFTTVYDERGTEGRFAARAPRTSFLQRLRPTARTLDRKSTRLNSSHANISYAVFCLKKKKNLCHKTIFNT